MNITNNLEIERKFLVEYPNVNTLDVKQISSIVQTYLQDGNNGSQRRIREISENGIIKYTYTEKIFRSAAVREEYERYINAEEYQNLILQAKKEFKPVNKTRYVFDYMGQLFELDCYSFSNKFAILELELQCEEQRIIFPENINVIAEVTSDHKYSNASLANAGCFPDEKSCGSAKEEC